MTPDIATTKWPRMRRCLMPALLAVGWLGLLACPPAPAATVTIKISAVNPIEKAQRKEIRTNLPPGIGTNDVLNLDGMDLRYDIKQDVFYVYKVVDLMPMGRVDYRVQLKDVWTIPEERFTEFREQADRLADKLKSSEFMEVGNQTRDGIFKDLDRVRGDQNKNLIQAGARPVDHIRIYQQNMVRLQDVKDRIGQLENLVLGTGQDPGSLIGDIKGMARPSRTVELRPEDYREALIRVTVRNRSPTTPRKTDVRHDLPAEVTVDDVLDPGGLQVVSDVKRGICTLVKDGLELAPGESVTFNVKIRDKWNINRPRCFALRTAASNLLDRVSTLGQFQSVETLLTQALDDIGRIEAESRPTELNERYVAFFRGQADRLDEIEKRIQRVESALQPMKNTTKLGFKAKPPSEKTTWLIIYIILGFLMLISLLFFLRWYGKSKSERMD